jgi:hypothetical protein
MHMSLESAGPPITETDALARLQALLSNVHPSLPEHFSQLNGASARGYFVRFGEDETGGLTLLGFDFPIGDIEETLQVYKHRIPPNYLPIATDFGGNLFLVSPSGKVRFWDHDDQTVVAAFDSIAGFLSALVPEPRVPSSRPDYAGMPLNELEELIAAHPQAEGWAACRAGRLDAVPQLLASHIELGGEFLNAAATGGQTTVINALLDGGIDINTRNQLGFTPLMCAAMRSELSAVDLLLTRGADPTLRSKGRTAARLAPIFRVRKRLKEAIANWEA